MLRAKKAQFCHYCTKQFKLNYLAWLGFKFDMKRDEGIDMVE
jgi:hypothetical protein